MLAIPTADETTKEHVNKISANSKNEKSKNKRGVKGQAKPNNIDSAKEHEAQGQAKVVDKSTNKHKVQSQVEPFEIQSTREQVAQGQTTLENEALRKTLPQVAFGPHETLVNCSAAIDVVVKKGKGRSVVANRDIPAGTQRT